MKRPIVIAIIGYIIGIIWGIYNKSIFPFWLSIIVCIFLIKKIFIRKRKFKILSIKRYFRYIKLFINKKSFILIIIVSIISNIIVIDLNKQYEKIYNMNEEIEIIGTIIGSKIEKKFYNIYTIKSSNKHIYIYVDKKINLDYGDKLYLKGKYKRPEIQRNYKGFDYSKYLKSKKIYGTIIVKDIQILEKNNCLKIIKKLNDIRAFLKQKINNSLNGEEKDILLGIILGDNQEIDDETIENFKISNLSHILAISGMHISYIILTIEFVLKKLIGYRKSNYVTIIVIILYMLFIGFSPSIVRASIMGILTIISRLLYRKSDTITNISLSMFIILIINPFAILDLSFQFSYAGTIGIVLFNKTIFKMLKSIKNKYNKSIFDQKKGNAISTILSAQIFVFPISILNNGTIGIYFIITNLLANIIIGPIIIIGIIYFFSLAMSLNISNIIAFLLKNLLKILMFISNIKSLPFAKNYLAIPNSFLIILYFIIIFFIQANFLIYEYQIPKNQTVQRIRNIIALIKYRLKMKKRVINVIVFLIFVFTICYNITPKNLKIYFIDVGQGDSTFIVTPRNKTILIDGGGQENLDVGKKTLLPYILNRGFTKVDYIIISHFDTDHVGGILSIMEELKVGKVIISKQVEDSDNYEKFKEIVNNKKVNVIVVNKGDRLKIEKDLYFDILWPNNENLISQNGLNNNSIVCKLNYKDFSILFTGDIEEIAEKQILEEYKNNLKILNSSVLKVAHHGSKSSSNKELLNVVKPYIALIGVGKDNKFGHPSEETIEKFEILGSNIYRTDEMGEISIKVDNKLRVKVKNKKE